MSYSFSITAASKEDAKQKIATAFDDVVGQQPTHAKDREQALVAAGAFLDLIADPQPGHELAVSMHGSLGWNHDTPEQFTGAGFGFSVHARAKQDQPGQQV